MERFTKADQDRILPVLRARLAGLGTTLAPTLPTPVPALGQPAVEVDVKGEPKEEEERSLSLSDHCYEYNRFSPVDPEYAILFYPDGSRKFTEDHQDKDESGAALETPYLEVGDQATPKPSDGLTGTTSDTKGKRKRGASETLSEIFSCHESEGNDVEIIDGGDTYNAQLPPAKSLMTPDPWEGVRQTARHANNREKWRKDLEAAVTGTITQTTPLVVEISDDEEEAPTSEALKTDPDQQGRTLKETVGNKEVEQPREGSGNGPDKQGGELNNPLQTPEHQAAQPQQYQGDGGGNNDTEGEPVKHSISLLLENGHDPDDFTLNHSVNSLSARVRHINGGQMEYAGPNPNRWTGYVTFTPNWDPERDLASYDIPGCPKFTDFSISGSREPRVASILQREVE